MTEQDEDFRKGLRALFTDEVLEHVDALCFGLAELEKAAGERRRGIIESLQREAHSLAGASRSLHLPSVEAICRSVEGVFTALRDGEIALTFRLFAILQEAFDALRPLAAREEEEEEGAAPEPDDLRRLVERLEKVRSGSAGDGGEDAADRLGGAIHGKRSTAPTVTDTVRVSSGQLASLLRRAEELLCEAAVSAERTSELRGIRDAFAAWREAWEEVGTELRGILQAAGYRAGEAAGARIADVRAFLARSDGDLAGLARRLAALGNAAVSDQRVLARAARELHDDAREAMRQPFSALLDMFPAFVRDLARDRGKDVTFSVRGGDIAGDRRIMEVVKCTLIHLVTFSLESGIEIPEERQRRDKPPRGRLECVVSLREDGAVEIVVADDGAGIAAEKLEACAAPAGDGAGRDEAAASTLFGGSELAASLFHPEGGPASLVADIAGLGLGLAVVSEKLGTWGGTITAATKADAGTAFRIVIPLPLSTLRGVLVRVAGLVLAVPAANIGRVVRIAEDDVKTVEGRETLVVDGQVVALCRLGEVLELPEAARAEPPPPHALVIACNGTRIAFAVDEVLREQEIVVKPWGRQLARVRNVSGATMLGNGKIVPVLHAGDLVKSAVYRASDSA